MGDILKAVAEQREAENKNPDPYKKGCELRDNLEKLTLHELVSLNPTLQQFRSIFRVMRIGHGEGAVGCEGDFEEVEILLRRHSS